MALIDIASGSAIYTTFYTPDEGGDTLSVSNGAAAGSAGGRWVVVGTVGWVAQDSAGRHTTVHGGGSSGHCGQCIAGRTGQGRAGRRMGSAAQK